MPHPPAVVRTPDREAEALAEIAATRISGATAGALIAAFLVALLAGPALELALPAKSRPAPAPLPARAAGGARPLRVRLAELTKAVDRYGALARNLRPVVQSPLLRSLRYGNGQVVVGRDGWLFLQESFAHTVGPGFLPAASAPDAGGAGGGARDRPLDPLHGIVGLDRQLRRRGIRLVVLPVPEKEQVYPERLSAGAWGAPAQNESFRPFVRRLRRAGVLVFDPATTIFAAARTDSGLYLAADTHWTPRGLDLAARALAGFLGRRLGPSLGPAAGLRRKAIELRMPVDLAVLLGLGSRTWSYFPPAAAPGFSVVGPDGEPFSALGATAPLVVLGDSFSLVYTRDAAGGGSTGFAEQLAYHLDRRVALRARVTWNNLTNRTDWLSSEPDLLAQARVIVYEFASRKLSEPAIWRPARLRGPESGRAASGRTPP